MPTRAASKSPTRKKKSQPQRIPALKKAASPKARASKKTSQPCRIPRPAKAKVRVRSVRSQIERGVSEITLQIPALITIGEMAEIAKVSKPTAVRILNRGDVRAYRPNGPGGVVLVHAESLARHIRAKSAGGLR